jgi:hypothetical protein
MDILTRAYKMLSVLTIYALMFSLMNCSWLGHIYLSTSLLASILLSVISTRSSSNPLQRPSSGDFDPEKSLQTAAYDLEKSHRVAHR